MAHRATSAMTPLETLERWIRAAEQTGALNAWIDRETWRSISILPRCVTVDGNEYLISHAGGDIVASCWRGMFPDHEVLVRMRVAP